MSMFLLGSLSGTLLGWLMGFLSLFLILLILIQRGKGGGLTGALGGPGGQSAFGSKAGDTFTVITIVVASIWGFTCAFTMWLLGTHAPTVKPPTAMKAGPSEDDNDDETSGLVIPKANSGTGLSGIGPSETDTAPDETPSADLVPKTPDLNLDAPGDSDPGSDDSADPEPSTDTDTSSEPSKASEPTEDSADPDSDTSSSESKESSTDEAPTESTEEKSTEGSDEAGDS